MRVQIPGSSTTNPDKDRVRVRKVEPSSGGPTQEVKERQDPKHNRDDFLGDLAHATERVRRPS